MVQCLIAEGYRIRDIQMDNVENGTKSYDIQLGGFTAWLEFGSIEEAFGMKDTFSIDGTTVNFWHKGKQKCTECLQQGHKSDQCAKVQEAIKRARERRNAYRQRKNK